MSNHTEREGTALQRKKNYVWVLRERIGLNILGIYSSRKIAARNMARQGSSLDSAQ